MEPDRIYRKMSGHVETAHDDSFEAFHALWRDRLRRALAMAIGDADLADDAIDEAMTKALAMWGRIGDYESPEGWVYRVGLNYSRDRFRRRRYELPQQILEHALTTEDQQHDLDLIQAVGRLPVKYRGVIVARYYLDWSTTDTARALGIAEGTVKSRISRAVDRLSQLLGEKS